MSHNRATAAYTWSRHRRLMRWLMAVTVALMVVALRLAGQHAGNALVRRYVVAALVVGAAMLASSTLMGLVFLFRQMSLSGKSLFRPAPPTQPPTGYHKWAVGPGERDGTDFEKRSLALFQTDTKASGENPPPVRPLSDAPE